MPSWGKEPTRRPRSNMPVRVGVGRKTMGHLYNGGTLHPTFPQPQNVVKTPQGLRLVPAKRNILGQCLMNSPRHIVDLPSQGKEQIPRKMPRQVYNKRVEPLTDQTLNQTSSTSSPLVPLDEYEKHHQAKANIGIFKDLENFRFVPETHSAHVPYSAKRKSNSGSKRKKQYTTSNTAEVKAAQILRQPSRLDRTLIPIPKSPHLYSMRKDPVKVSTLTSATSVKELGDLPSTSSMLHDPSNHKTYTNNLSSMYTHESIPQHPRSQLKPQNKTSTIKQIDQCSRPTDEKNLPQLGARLKQDYALFTHESIPQHPRSQLKQQNKTSTIEQIDQCGRPNDKKNLPQLGARLKQDDALYTHESVPQHPHSQLKQQNKTSTIEQIDLCGRRLDETKSPQLGDDQQCNVTLTSNAQTCISIEPKLPGNCRSIELQSPEHKSDLHDAHSCIYPVLEMEQKQLSLLQEQFDLQEQQVNLQKQLSDVQRKQANCLKKMMELQEENIKFLQNQSVRPTKVKEANIVGAMSVTPVPEIFFESPVPKRRRSARLASQSRSEADVSQFIASGNSTPEMSTQFSLTKDNDSSKKTPQSTGKSGMKKQNARKRSVVEYYGGLRSAFKHLLQTPKETPCPGSSRSAKKVQFAVQDTPARLSSNVIKQLNSLYDDS